MKKLTWIFVLILSMLTSQALTASCGCPSVETGPRGSSGPPGPTGATGVQGATGPQGAPGSDGAAATSVNYRYAFTTVDENLSISVGQPIPFENSTVFSGSTIGYTTQNTFPLTAGRDYYIHFSAYSKGFSTGTGVQAFLGSTAVGPISKLIVSEGLFVLQEIIRVPAGSTQNLQIRVTLGNITFFESGENSIRISIIDLGASP